MVFEIPRRRFLRSVNSKYIYGRVVSGFLEFDFGFELDSELELELALASAATAFVAHYERQID